MFIRGNVTREILGQDWNIVGSDEHSLTTKKDGLTFKTQRLNHEDCEPWTTYELLPNNWLSCQICQQII